IHRAPWPQVAEERSDDALLAIGKTLVTIATAVRRYKSKQQLPLGTEFARLTLATTDRQLADRLSAGIADLRSIARVREVVIGVELPAENVIGQEDTLEIGIER
ncbi:MAG: hypothetical protein KDE53_34120, partial [Caldilineaceae bacterium]|nr:hypothetical protein [Caldilineaceae bacterium]